MNSGHGGNGEAFPCLNSDIHSCSQARDEDSQDNKIIDFSIPSAEFVSKNGATNPVQVFRITRSVEADLYTGNIQ